MEQLFLTADEVASACRCSKQKAYGIIRHANEDLKKKGFLIQQGKIPRKYFLEMVYGEKV